MAKKRKSTEQIIEHPIVENPVEETVEKVDEWIWNDASNSYIPRTAEQIVTEKVYVPIKERIINFIKPLSIFKGINPIFYLIFVILLGLVIYFTIFSSSDIRKENRELREEVKNIQEERDALKDSINVLKEEYQKYEDSLSQKYAELEFINERLKQIENSVNKSNSALNETRKSVSVIRNQITNKEKNPSNRTGDTLLNSLSRRLNKN
jgi:uncharacterized protein YukE